MKIDLQTFDGIAPKVTPELLKDTAAQTAENCLLESGKLVPIKTPLEVTTLPTSGRKTVYLWRYKGAGGAPQADWLSWPGVVDVTAGPVADDQYSRIYYTDGSVAKVKGYDGGIKEDDLVLVKPAAAPTATLNAWFAISDFKLYVKAATKSKILDLPQFVKEGYFRWSSRGEIIVNQSLLDITEESGYARVLYATINAGTHQFFDESDGEATEPELYSRVVTLADGRKLLLHGSHRVYPSPYQDTGATWTLIIDCEMWGEPIGWEPVEEVESHRYYCMTYVHRWGAEGPPSAISDQVDVAYAEDIELTALSVPASTTLYPKKRIYRTAGTGEAADWYFLAEINSADTTYTDELEHGELAKNLTATTAPDADIEGLTLMPGGFLAAFKGREIWFSEPWHPHNWPSAYRLIVDFPVVGLGASGNDLVVLTTGQPYLISGSHPEIMVQSKLMIPQSCVGRQGVAQLDQFVVYPSPDGLVALHCGEARVLTDAYFSKAQWQAFVPAAMTAAVYDRKYYGFFASGGGIIVDFDSSKATITTTDQNASAAYSDLETDKLYVVQATKLNQWDAGATSLLAEWMSKRFMFSTPMTFSAAIVNADSYPADPDEPVKLLLYVNGSLVQTMTVTGSRSFRLPVLRPELRWALKVTTEVNVNRVAIATSIRDLQA